MQKLRAATCALLATAAIAIAMPAFANSPNARPNIVVIVADDLGFSDISSFGSEIRTPNLDALAENGLKLTNFHTTPVCSPTRAELLTGIDHHQTGLGNFAELLQPNQKGKPGYEGYLNDRVVTIAEVLRDNGYKTLLSGKWHLGYDPRANPAARGFERSFALLGGGHNHFGRDAKMKLSMPNAGVVYTQDGSEVGIPENFYSSDYFTDKLIAFLPDRQQDKRPFFAYLSFTAPHDPLQAPAEDIERYKGQYDEGYEVNRQKRLSRLQELGLVPAGVEPHDFSALKPWSELSEEERRIEARKMEVYAGMVDRLDQNVGRLVQVLKERGEYDNTIFLFLSDNGAEGRDITWSVIPEIAEAGKKQVARSDNSLESMGSARSFVWRGSNWAEAATAPSRLTKSFPTEGGTRVVAFVSFPGGKMRRGVSHTYMSVRDVMPTLIDYGRAKAPVGTYKGKPIIPLQGRSLAEDFAPGASDRDSSTVVASGEMFGRRYTRSGQWKAVHIPPPTGPGRWELFNVVEDPGEVHDLAEKHPDILERLIAQWDQYALDNGVVMPEIAGN